MAESVSTAVEVHVDEATTVHVPEEVALAPVDDQVDTAVGPELCLVRIPELFRLLEHLCLRVEAEEVVVVHRPFPGGGGSAGRSEARRVGEEGVSRCRSRWSPENKK